MNLILGDRFDHIVLVIGLQRRKIIKKGGKHLILRNRGRRSQQVLIKIKELIFNNLFRSKNVTSIISVSRFESSESIKLIPKTLQLIRFFLARGIQ